MTGSDDGTAIVWDAESGTVIREWLAHWGAVSALSFSPDSQRLVSAGGESGDTLVVWDLSNGVIKAAVLASIDPADPKTAVGKCIWSPDGTLIASTCGDVPVRVWDAQTFRQRCLLSVDDLAIPSGRRHNLTRSLQWSPDSRYLAWTCYAQAPASILEKPAYNEWAIWSPLTEALPKMHPSHPTRHVDFYVTALSFNPESRHITTTIWKHFKFSESDFGDSIEGASEGDRNPSDGHSGYVLIWDIASGTTLVVLGLGHEMKVHDMSFSPDGRALLCLSVGGLMKIWDTECWQETASLYARDSCWHFSPGGQYVAATSKNDDSTGTFTVQLWRISEASCVAVFTEHKEWIGCLAFSPDGRFLASGDGKGLVYVRRLSDFIGH